MRFLPVLTALAATSFASDMRPYFLVNAGMTLPKVEVDEQGDAEMEDIFGYSGTIGLGLRKAVSPQMDLDVSAGFSAVQGGEKVTESDKESYPGTSSNSYRDGYTTTSSSEFEASLTPKLIDLQGGVLFHATPRLGLGASLVYSIPVGGNYEVSVRFSEEIECNDPSSTSCYEGGMSLDSDDDGKIDDLMDDADTEVRSFMSLKLEGEYTVNDRLCVTAGWMLPLGDYLSEDGNTVSWSRAVVGIKYAFSMPGASGSSSTAPASAPQ